MLTLPIKKIWFDKIKSGEKTTEYRKLTKYYAARLYRYKDDKEGLLIKLRNGYRKDSPSITVRVIAELGKGSEQPYLDFETWYWALRIKEVI